MHGSNLLSIGELALWDYIKGVFLWETNNFFLLIFGRYALGKIFGYACMSFILKEQEEFMN